MNSVKHDNAWPRPYLSVGFDVGADFSLMAIETPDGKEVGKPGKITHDDPASRERALKRIKEAQESYSLEARCFFESTGPYHIPLLHFFQKKGLDCILINPLLSKNSTNGGVRKVHSDKADAKKIAHLGQDPGIKPSQIPDEVIFGLRMLVRDYASTQDHATAVRQKLQGALKVSFPQFISCFSCLDGAASLAVLELCPTPQNVLDADESELHDVIKASSRRGAVYADNKVKALKAAAADALASGYQTPADESRIHGYIRMLRSLRQELQTRLKEIQQYADIHADHLDLKQNIRLLLSIHGVGFLSAVTLLAEIGCFKAFQSPRALYAYFGLDPAVNRSGKKTTDNCRTSKRGSALARRVLHLITLQNLAVRGGEPVNPPLYAFYMKKCESRSRLKAMGAAMHKICNIIFAVLRDQTEFVLRTPEEHKQLYAAAHSLAV